MQRYKKQTPEGVQDCLPKECFIKRNIEAELRIVFLRCGFDEVETPTFEYYDVFSTGVGSYMQEKMIKFFDAKGRILVLRPDLTVPIARMYSAGFAGQKKRFFYIQNAFSFEQPAYGKSGEYTQAGIELIGEQGCTTDAEAVFLAVKALRASGLKDFKIDIGQVGFFKSLLQDASLQEKTLDAIRHNIDIKNMLELENVLSETDLSAEKKQTLMALPTLYGGEEALSRAEDLCANRQSREALQNLRDVYALLCGFGIGEYITVDLGMLHDIGYYSGMVFRGLAEGIGFPVISGGRYDRLIKEFGVDAPAIGFAMGIKRVMIALEKQGLLDGASRTDCVVGAAAGHIAQAHAFCESQRRLGKRVVFCTDGGVGSVSEQKRAAGAREAYFFDDDGQKPLE